MARPPVVVLPGNTGMGGSFTKSTAPNLLELLQGLSQLASLYQGTIGAANKDEANQAGNLQLLNLTRGVNPAEAGQSGSAIQMPSGGMVNQPRTPTIQPTDKVAISKSPTAMEAFKKLFGQQNEPEKWSATQSEKGPVLYGEKSGEFGKVFDAPKNRDIATTPFKEWAITNFGGDLEKAQMALETPEGKTSYEKSKVTPTEGNLTFDTFTDKNGVSYRIGYDKATGAEVTRVKQGQGNKRDAYKEDAVMTRIVNAFNSDPNMRQVERMDNFSQLILDVAKSDNPIGHASLETLMARASGEVGNLSEADKKPFGGSRALSEKLKQTVSELYSGKKTPENLQFISQLAQTFQETGQRKKVSLARERASQYARANKEMGWTPEEVFRTLVPNGEYKEPSAKKPASNDMEQFWK